MPRGVKLLARIAEESKAKRDAYDAGGSDYQRALVLKNPGQSATGRFCEEGEGITFAYTHDLPLKPGKTMKDKVLCLNQDDLPNVPCYACEQGLPRSTRLIMNFIRYDEPKLARDGQGKPIKDNFGNYQFETTTDPATGQRVAITEYALVVFVTGASAGGRIAYLEEQHGGDEKHGIASHVVKIVRTPDNQNPYMIDVVKVDALPPSAEEMALFNKKIDPMKAITQLGKRSVPAMSYGDMVQAYSGMSVPSGFAPGGTPNGAQQLPSGNPYVDAQQSHDGVKRSAFS
jgi:hypothetical protein